ncbi:MAG: hypothetical protein K940chlam2_00393 [Chlamydiae bacterium]|nr:hypothetical protein [Chlamydiota bacterium]
MKLFSILFWFAVSVYFQIGFSSEYPQASYKVENQNVVENMREKIRALGEHNNFIFVDLGIAADELNSLNKFKVESPGQYDRFGSLHILNEELPSFLQSIGNNTAELIQEITEIISKVVCNIKEASNKETAWVSVRVFTPTHTFDVPRWHCDGYYYSPYSGAAFKFATVLKGTSTMFYPLPQNMRKTFRSHCKDRTFLANLIKQCHIESPKLGQGAFFLVGDMNNACVHSEPKIDGERIFFSVMPGNENEINELKERWAF